VVLTQRSNIAAGTEGALACRFDHDPVNERVVAPFSEGTGAGPDHRQVQRIKRLRAVQYDASDTSVEPCDHCLFVWHLRLRDGRGI
jgi:hypothetical protein